MSRRSRHGTSFLKSATAYLNSLQERREGDDFRSVLSVVNAS